MQMGRRGRHPLQTERNDEGMEPPNRKPNRLPDYDYDQNGAYFITICTQDRKPILGHIVGGGALDAPSVILSQIGKIAHKYILSSNRMNGPTIEKYVIMPDHIHLILRVDVAAAKGTSRAPSPTNAAVPHFVSTFKRFCHRDVGSQIFQRSYYDHVIRNQKDYDEIWEYIENNPGKWMIQKNP